MKANNYQINLGFEQILDLVKQLPRKEKLKLTKALEKEMIKTKLSSLLEAFKTDKISQKTIDQEVELVRASIYAKSKNK
ncbi:MAG: hypothetical protein O9302_11120 [Cyclobacteriaceae bacterium]|jgi:hypothetical protein|nr:hypothetical protein [Flammeovirgaceae bacterium]MCZ8021119.1 hypothetical protein [Cytophagales bacterium]MCZ8328602.1 hypothetical protein [Cyclobacteriaceae bacterium]